MFQDEARFGRMSDPRACWAPSPHRPVVNLALVREFKYEYAAVSPWDGDIDHITREKMNTESMSCFLKQVSKAHRGEFNIMIVDGASSHMLIVNKIDPLCANKTDPPLYGYKIIKNHKISLS